MGNYLPLSTPPRELKAADAPALVEPRIWERQPGENAKQYEAFLIFRDLPAAERGNGEPDKKALLTVSRIMYDDKERVAVAPTLMKLYRYWSWRARLDAYHLGLQTEASRRNENALLKLKTTIEGTCLKLCGQISELAGCDDEASLAAKRFLLVKLELLIGKGKAGEFLLKTHVALLGQKIDISGTVKHEVDALAWKP